MNLQKNSKSKTLTLGNEADRERRSEQQMSMVRDVASVRSIEWKFDGTALRNFSHIVISASFSVQRMLCLVFWKKLLPKFHSSADLTVLQIVISIFCLRQLGHHAAKLHICHAICISIDRKGYQIEKLKS